MTKREVIKCVLDGKKPPYVPWSFKFTKEPKEMLQAHYGVEDLDPVLGNHIMQLGSDIGFFNHLGGDLYQDVFQVVWDRSIDKDIGDVKGCVLSEPTLEGYQFPNPLDPRFFANIESEIAKKPDMFRVFQIGFSMYERRAFTAQIIINHVQARDGEKIDNVDQALQRAIDNGVKNLVVQPTHLMHGAEYDELVEALDNYKDKFESVTVAEPLLGEVGADATVVNEDKAKVAEDITAEAVKDAGYDSLEAVKADSTAFVFMGHGTSHTAKVSYSQMASQMAALGYDNVFVGTVEGEPEETACEAVIEAVKAAGYKNVILRPLMVVAGDHANNDMAGDDDSWKSMFTASGNFDKVDTQIAGLGEIEAVQQIYVDHTKAAIDSLGK